MSACLLEQLHCSLFRHIDAIPKLSGILVFYLLNQLLNLKQVKYHFPQGSFYLSGLERQNKQCLPSMDVLFTQEILDFNQRPILLIKDIAGEVSINRPHLVMGAQHHTLDHVLK